jgi:predicted aspartyl protease
MIFVDVKVNGGQTLKLILDSDSTRSTLDLDKARELGINVDKVALTKGTHAVTPQEIHIAENVSYAIGAVAVDDPISVAYSLGFLSKRLGRPIDGILGNALLRKFVVEIDYAARELRIHAPEAFRAPQTAHVARAELVNDHIRVHGSIQGVEGVFNVDTGIGGSHVVLYEKCSANPAITSALRDRSDMVATAFGGDRAEQKSTLDQLQIGGIEVPKPSVRLSAMSALVCGHVGNGFFEEFHNTTFDLPHGRLLLAR